MSKFRLWDKRFSEFVKDFFVSEDGKIYKKSTDTGYGIAISRETSDEVILMHSTGLFDKNGKEIFEGDILKSEQRDLIVVKLRQYAFTGLHGTKIQFLGYNIILKEGYKKMKTIEREIIGNIYENADLLSKEDNGKDTVAELIVKGTYDKKSERWYVDTDEATVETMNSFLKEHDLDVFESWLGYLEGGMSDESLAFVNILQTMEDEIELADGSKIKLVEG